MRYIFAFFVLVIVMMPIGLSSAPSFDCAKAKNDVEKTICASEELSWLDSRIDDFFYAPERAGVISKEQRAVHDQWLAERDLCSNLGSMGEVEDCIEGKYVERLNEVTPTQLFMDGSLGYMVYILSKPWRKQSFKINVADDISKKAELFHFVHSILVEVQDAFQIACAKCIHVMTVDISFENDAFMNLTVSKEINNGDTAPIFSVQNYIFSKEYNDVISEDHFFDDFRDENGEYFRDEELMSRVNKMMVDGVLQTINEKGQKATDTASDNVDLRAQIAKRLSRHQSGIGIYSDDESGKITHFIVHNDDNMFTDYFEASSLETILIDVYPFLPLISERYRGSFK